MGHKLKEAGAPAPASIYPTYSIPGVPNLSHTDLSYKPSLSRHPDRHHIGLR